MVYLDDVKVCSNKRSGHAHHLKQIFERCRKHRISLNPKKSMLFVSEHVGHVVSKHGFYVDPKRMKAIMHISIPNNKKSM
jgi:hypothetical protein